jgi:hypothetical protein
MTVPGLNFTSTRQSTSVAQNQSIAFNPSTVINFGASSPITSTPSGNASGAPSAPSNASGSDSVSPGGSGLPSWLPTGGGGQTATPLYGNPSLVGNPSGTGIPGQADNSLLPLLLLGGGAVLLFAMKGA